MPYFVDRLTLKVVVTAPGREAPSSDCIAVDKDLASRFHLRHDSQLTSVAAQALLDGDAERFAEEWGGEPEQLPPPRDTSPQLPQAGKWEYKVIPITEFYGFGTAKGTAERMQGALDVLAADGWELLTTTERDSRWIGGETVLLTFRRFVVTESMFLARAMAEERLRERAHADLATRPDTGS